MKKIMKKILYAVFSIMLLASCGGGKAKVTESDKAEARELIMAEIETANDFIAGKQVDYATVCDGCEFYNDEIHYYYTFNEDYVNVDLLKNNVGEIKQTQQAIIESMPATRELRDLLKTVNGKLIHHYTGDSSGRTVVVTVLDF